MAAEFAFIVGDDNSVTVTHAKRSSRFISNFSFALLQKGSVTCQLEHPSEDAACTAIEPTIRDALHVLFTGKLSEAAAFGPRLCARCVSIRFESQDLVRYLKR